MALGNSPLATGKQRFGDPPIAHQHDWHTCREMKMNLSSIRKPAKANEKRKRVGRGMGSGMGKTSTRGHKGQRSRSGSRSMRGFEGGQMPLHRRLPKRGFVNIFKKEFQIVNLSRLAELGQAELTPEVLYDLRVIAHKDGLIKVLGVGELSSPLTVHAHKFSETAQQKITAAGGKAEIIPVHQPAPLKRGKK
jgi:large subunit ribosomal protein L15